MFGDWTQAPLSSPIRIVTVHLRTLAFYYFSDSIVIRNWSLKSWCSNLTSALMKNKKSPEAVAIVQERLSLKRFEQLWEEREDNLPCTETMGKESVH